MPPCAAEAPTAEAAVEGLDTRTVSLADKRGSGPRSRGVTRGSLSPCAAPRARYTCRTVARMPPTNARFNTR
eukprot:2292016-Prymnesium_polylepis.1